MHENGAKELISHLKEALFFKDKSVLFVFLLPVYLPFVAVHALFFAWRRSEGLVKSR